VDDGTCTVEKSTDSEARVTLGLSMPNFVRLIAGQLDGMTAFTSGQLKISGDMMFTQTMTSWFTPPGS
jgi:putative sterol carrier protein